MVLTRRAAAAAAAAAAATDTTSTSSPPTDSPTEPDPNHTQPSTMPSGHTPPIPTSPNPPSASSAPMSSSSSSIDHHVASVCPSKLEQLRIDRACHRRGVTRRLYAGHVLAFVAALTLAHAATGLRKGRTYLGAHALVLLACVVPVRLVLALWVHSQSTPVKRSGMILALSAAVVFSSNALHVLATRVAPQMLRVLILCTAVDTSAMWLRMTVVAREPVVEPFALAFALLQSAADIFLAGVVGGSDSLQRLFWPFLAVRMIVNIGLVVNSASAIVRREGKER